jgi:hypothetical protein
MFGFGQRVSGLRLCARRRVAAAGRQHVLHVLVVRGSASLPACSWRLPSMRRPQLRCHARAGPPQRSWSLSVLADGLPPCARLSTRRSRTDGADLGCDGASVAAAASAVCLRYRDASSCPLAHRGYGCDRCSRTRGLFVWAKEGDSSISERG